MRYSQCYLLLLCCLAYPCSAVEFNTDLLDVAERENIDLSRFSQSGYIMPGTYVMSVRINENVLPPREIKFIEPDNEHHEVNSQACITEDILLLLGLKPQFQRMVKMIPETQCADLSHIEGVVIRGDLGESTLFISIPQAWLEYQDSSWLPPSRWENGIPGLILDYNFNSNISKPNSGSETTNASISGTTGANVGPWRLRADYQGSYNHSRSNGGTAQSFDWSRYYAFRAIPELMAKLTMGEDYLNSNLFDSWRFTGVSLNSDEGQLPPNLRGYAPEVAGIAKTNAKVTITQQGRVIYESTVAAGPFRIQELSNAVSGQLDVKVEEQDGSIQQFQVTAASVPYLTRPGQIRFKTAIGRPSSYDHGTEGPYFGTGEISWGVSSSWSLYTGSVISEGYQSFALGIGRDLYQLGALSADITHAKSDVPGESSLSGRSYRISYSKRFDELNSEVTFAGYRFSERDYLSMSEYLDFRYHNGTRGNSKELYTITASKAFQDAGMSAFLSWSHQTYWDREDSNNYSLSTSKYFDWGNWHNISANLSVNRRKYNGIEDDSIYLNLSLPFGNGNIGYNGNYYNDRYKQSASLYQRIDEQNSYRLGAGTITGQGESITADASGFYSHSGSQADISSNFSWSQNNYVSAGISASGGVTMTPNGAALHPSSGAGGTRMLVSTSGVSDVPIGRNGKSNMFGIAVEPNVASYYKTSTAVDVNRLPDDIETSGSPITEAALTEGAIGYRRFNIIQGAKISAVIAFKDGTHPPFGATIYDDIGNELGLVSDGGVAWISGVKPLASMNVKWGNNNSCTIELPKDIKTQSMLLPCKITE